MAFGFLKNLVACALVGALALSHDGVDAAEAAAKKCRRLRKPWEAYTQQEKETYISAVEKGMEKGYFSLLAQVHADKMVDPEAHQTCGFFLWHRRYLLAYENMLRSFGPEYECVTVPVWNYFGSFAMQTQGQCNSALECAPLLRDLGGATGKDKEIKIGDYTLGGNCVSERPVGSLCEGPDMDKAKCGGCLPRGEWGNVKLPPSLGYANLIKMLGSSKGYADLHNNVYYYGHGVVHNQLEGYLGGMRSPLDPAFFSLQ